jgi:predicted acetyltransferase
MSEFDGSNPDSKGRFDCGRYFHLYWSEPDRYPYLLCRGDAVIGFALVRQLTTGCHSISEFFILRACRRQGLARSFANALFELHPGQWSVAQLEANRPAQRFWRSVISEFTAGNFREGWSDSSPKGPMLSFVMTARPVAASGRPDPGSTEG